MLLFILFCFGLSALPIPEFLRPLLIFERKDPLWAFVTQVVSPPASVPRPSQGYVAGAGGLAIATEDTVPTEAEAEAPVPALPVQRAPSGVWERPARPRFERYAKALDLSAAPMERGCADPSPEGCRRFAMERFFRRLDQAADGEGSPVRVVHFGDSLIASDKISDTIRKRLQERFGSAGRGFLMVRKFNRFQRGNRSGDGSPGWVLEIITQGVLRDRFFGYTGASFTAQKVGEVSRFAPVAGAEQVELHYLEEPKGGRLELRADGEVLGRVDTLADRPRSDARVKRFDLGAGVEALELEALSPGARVFGVVLESRGPGVVYESIGLPGATSEVWTRPQREDFIQMLAARQPALVVHMVGGNDGLMLSKKRTALQKIEAAMNAFFDRVAEAAPEADCLIVTPFEAVRAKADGRKLPKPEVQDIAALQRKLAEARGCGLWDMYTSMGGEGSLQRWIDADLMLADLIHPRSRGSDLIGEMFAESLMEAYDNPLARTEARD
ncbi:MAG: GDSL-type esterase/lipase family protein [Myxococcota bacterium]